MFKHVLNTQAIYARHRTQSGESKKKWKIQSLPLGSKLKTQTQKQVGDTDSVKWAGCEVTGHGAGGRVVASSKLKVAS